MKVIVAGAGIGGLAAALSLHAAGIEATGIPTAEMVHFDRHGNRIWGFASGQNIGYRRPGCCRRSSAGGGYQRCVVA